MVLKTLVEAILQSYREPNNLIYIQLLQTLKRDVAQDVTDAFQLGKPLVNKHPDLYRNSTSFLDFLFKLCDAPRPPEILCLTSTDNTEWIQLKSRLEADLDSQKQKLKEMNLQVCEYKKNLDAKQIELTNSHCQLAIQQQKNQDLEKSLELQTTENLPFSVQPPPAIEAGWLEEVKLLQTDVVNLVNDFKEEVTHQFGMTLQNQNRLDELVSKLLPPSGSETLALPYKPVESAVDKPSELGVEKLETFLTKENVSQQAKDLMNLIELDTHFLELREKLENIKLPEVMQRKIEKCVQSTQLKLTRYLKQLFQNLAKLHEKDIVSPLYLMQKADKLEEELRVKKTQLAQDPCKPIMDYYKTYNPTLLESENWVQNFIKMVEDDKLKLNRFTQQLTMFQKYFSNLNEENWASLFDFQFQKLDRIYERMRNAMANENLLNYDADQFDTVFFAWLNKNVDNMKNELASKESQLQQNISEKNCEELGLSVPSLGYNIIEEAEDWEDKYIKLKSTFDVVKPHCIKLLSYFDIQMASDFSDTERDWSKEIIQETTKDREKLNELKLHSNREIQEKLTLITELKGKLSENEKEWYKNELKYVQDKKDLEAKCSEIQKEASKKYNKCMYELEKEQEKTKCVLGFDNLPKKRKRTETGLSADISSQYLKALLLCLFEKYFSLLWTCKQTPNVVLPEFKTKLEILNALVINMRPNELLLVLIRYVELDLNVPLGEEGKEILHNLIDEVKSYTIAKELLDASVEQTIFKLTGPPVQISVPIVEEMS